MDYLLGQNEPEKAAKLCPKILKNNAKLWEETIYNFSQKNQLKVGVMENLSRTS